MTGTSIQPIVETNDRVLVITRTFDAPRELVFEAWSKPEHLVRWWGPNDFTLPFCETDFRVGGNYRYCMRSPEGEDHWVWGKYEEIVPPEKIVFTWDRNDLAGNLRSSSIVKVTFGDIDGQTVFRLEQGVFEHQWDCEEHSGGWLQALERLRRYLK